MALFKNMAITNQGMALYAKAQAGQEIHFTKMQVGSGQIETQNPVTLLALLDPKLDVPITSITANPEMKSATIIGNITNKDVTEATYICELGLFAKDPDEGEILYGYVSAGQYGDYYAPEAQGPYSWQYEINAAIGNAANVIAEVSRLNWDHSVINSNKTFLHLTGGNQKEINKSIDDNFESVTKQLADITTDNKRLTNSKDITGAINELFTNANNGKQNWVDVIGEPLTTKDTFSTLKNKTQTIKSTLANNLCDKKVNASGTESLKNLVNKVTNISSDISAIKDDVDIYDKIVALNENDIYVYKYVSNDLKRLNIYDKSNGILKKSIELPQQLGKLSSIILGKDYYMYVSSYSSKQGDISNIEVSTKNFDNVLLSNNSGKNSIPIFISQTDSYSTTSINGHYIDNKIYVHGNYQSSNLKIYDSNYNLIKTTDISSKYNYINIVNFDKHKCISLCVADMNPTNQSNAYILNTKNDEYISKKAFIVPLEIF